MNCSWRRVSVGENGVIRPVAAERQTRPSSLSRRWCRSQMPAPPVPVSPAPVSLPMPASTVPASPVSAAPSNRSGLFERRAVPVPGSPRAASELHALLDLPTTTPKRDWEGAPDHAQRWCIGRARVEVAYGQRGQTGVAPRLAEDRRPGGSRHGRRADCGRHRRHRAASEAFGSESIAPAPSQTVAPQSRRASERCASDAWRRRPCLSRLGTAVPATVEGAVTPSEDTWVVQVGVFSIRNGRSAWWSG